MYKIYISEKPILLDSVSNASQYDRRDLRNLVVDYDGRKNNLYRYVDNFEKGTKALDSIILLHSDLDQLKEDFFAMFKIVKAAGGLVRNDEGKVLSIFRNGYWDLPKGKVEKNENIDSAAIREVMEETGLQNIVMDALLTETFHTYRIGKEKRVLKWSYWYRMQSNDVALQPQTEEGIEQVCWLSAAELAQKRPIYNNILEVLDKI